MKKSLKIMLTVLVICVIGLFYVLQYLSMEFSDGADYTEKDKREYNFYTPELLKICLALVTSTASITAMYPAPIPH